VPYRTLYKDVVLSDRERKNIVLLDVIRRNGPIAKTDIARITKHNIVTVSNYVEHYIKQKLVVEKGLDVSSGGRRPELVELNGEWGTIVGVDIAHTHITGVVATLNPRVLYKETIPRPAGHMESVLGEAVRLVQKVMKLSGADPAKVKGIGVGISGVIDKNAGTVRDTDVTRGTTVGNFVSAKGILEKEFRVPVVIGNDASLAAMAEKKLSLRIDDENILYMYGDVGSGIIVHNELFWGSSWSAGETQLNLAGAEDLNLPAWVSESNFFRSRGQDMGIVEDVRKIMGDPNVKSALFDLIDRKPEKLTLELILDYAQKNDAAMVAAADRAVTLLGLKVAYLTNFFNPEVVVVGGGFEKGGDFVLNRIRAVVKKLVMEEAASAVKVILSRLGKDAVALGAVSLVTQELFAEV
jgi:predicted NBD/HSP70 family sugar kinase